MLRKGLFDLFSTQFNTPWTAVASFLFPETLVKMIFTLKELKKWLQVTIFEFTMILLSVFVFSIMLVLKLEELIDISWWSVFIPLYTCDTLMVYFDLIVFINLYLVSEKRLAVKRIIINAVMLLLIIIYKVLLCQQLEGTRNMNYANLHAPVFLLFFFLLMRACFVYDNTWGEIYGSSVALWSVKVVKHCSWNRLKWLPRLWYTKVPKGDFENKLWW